MVSEITPEEMAVYRATARRRREERSASLAQRRERALKAAHAAANLLKEQFGATRVVLFGSLTRPDYFAEWSDVDIAAWGIAPGDTFRAIGEVLGIDPEVEVNLVDVEWCRPAILTSIEREGLDL